MGDAYDDEADDVRLRVVQTTAKRWAREVYRLKARERKLVELLRDLLDYQGDRLPTGWQLTLRAAIKEDANGKV